MKFWPALRESILEMCFGAHQLQAWRAEKAQREECERVLQKQYDEYLKQVHERVQ